MEMVVINPKCHEAGLRILSAVVFFFETARESSFKNPDFPESRGFPFQNATFWGPGRVKLPFFHPATIHVLSPYLLLLPLEVHRHSEA